MADSLFRRRIVQRWLAVGLGTAAVIHVLATAARPGAATIPAAVRPIRTAARDVRSLPIKVDKVDLVRLDSLQHAPSPMGTRNLFALPGPHMDERPFLAWPETRAAAASAARPGGAPVLVLIGMAEDASGRTAIISDGAEVYFAREGDLVRPGYRVSRIALEDVALVDPDDAAQPAVIVRYGTARATVN